MQSFLFCKNSLSTFLFFGNGVDYQHRISFSIFFAGNSMTHVQSTMSTSSVAIFFIIKSISHEQLPQQRDIMNMLLIPRLLSQKRDVGRNTLRATLRKTAKLLSLEIRQKRAYNHRHRWSTHTADYRAFLRLRTKVWRHLEVNYWSRFPTIAWSLFIFFPFLWIVACDADEK